MIKAQWQQLNTREQQLVAFMTTVVVIFIFYSFVWQPLNEGLVKADKKIVKQQQLLSWVQENTARYKQNSRGGKANKASGSLSSIINRTANSANISIDRIQQQGEDIQVWLEDISFNTLLSWLETLSNEQGLSIKSIDLTDSDQEGAVNVRRLQIGK